MKRTILTLVAIVAAFAITAARSDAGITFNLESKTVSPVTPGGPISGFVNVFLTADGGDVGLPLSGAQAHIAASAFTGSISGVTFGPMGASIGLTSQFPGGFFSPIGASPGNVASGVTVTSGPVALVSGNGLFSVPFTIAAGQTGTFRLDFVTSGSVQSELYDGTMNAGVISGVQFSGGTITAVPEPSSIAFVLIGTIGAAAWRIRRKKLAVQ